MSDPSDYAWLQLEAQCRAAIDKAMASFELMRQVAAGECGEPGPHMRLAALALIDSGLLLYGHSDDAELRAGIEKIRSACAAEIDKQNHNNTPPRRQPPCPKSLPNSI